MKPNQVMTFVDGIGTDFPRSGSAIAFFDAMNLFYDVKSQYGYGYPNFDVLSLAETVSTHLGLTLRETRYYSGIHSRKFSVAQHDWLRNKVKQLRSQGVFAYTRQLSYAEGVPREKGIDLRLALDVVDAVFESRADTVIVFSRDQDYTELLGATRKITKAKGTELRLVSAFPVSEGSKARGIDGFDWFRISREMYDACIDPRDYRPRSKRSREGG